ncbi:hypothetical protein U1Q18_006057 [Sarracenia purpurea var. burkii]
MEIPKVQDILEKQVLTVAKASEDKIDDEIAALDRLDLGDIEVLRERRLQQILLVHSRSRLRLRFHFLNFPSLLYRSGLFVAAQRRKTKEFIKLRILISDPWSGFVVD